MAQKMTRCFARGCGARIPAHMLMCKTHWRMVPKPIQDDVWRTYKAGPKRTGHMTDDYIEAIKAARVAVAAQEVTE